MSEKLFTVIFFLFVSMGAKSQINLVGAASNQNTGMIDIVKWQANDPASVTTIPSILEGYVFGSSAYDAYSSLYYLTGLNDTAFGLFSYNTNTNVQSMQNNTFVSNICEFDMATGKFYNLRMDSSEYISVNEFDIKSGSDSLIGTIYEPGANGIVADAIGFDANNGILYYVGFNDDPALCLYAISVRDGEFSFTRTNLITTAPYNNITSVNYDNVNDRIYALNATFDSTFNYTGSRVVEIDKTGGEIIVRGELVEFPYFVAGSSSFDQYTGSFMVVGIDTNFQESLIIFDTYANVYETGFIPGLVSEIVCDNTDFAMNNYILTSVITHEEVDFRVSPNPATDWLKVAVNAAEDVLVRVYSTNGKLVISKNFSAVENIELYLDFLPSGAYLVNLLSGRMSGSKKIQVL